MRWVLRGLGTDLAIRKAQLAADVRGSAIRRISGGYGQRAHQIGPVHKFRSGSDVVDVRPIEKRMENEE